MKPDRLERLVRRFQSHKVAVVGDFFLDKYIEVDPDLAEISLETGKTAHQVVAIRRSPGAAGTVVNNLVALCAGRVYVVGFTGRDGEGFELRRALRQLGCDTEGLFALEGRFTPTYLKPRSRGISGLAGEHERYDTKNRKPTPVKVQDRILGRMEYILPDTDAVIVVDQVEEEGCGVVTQKIREGLADFAARGTGRVFWADSRSRIGEFRNVMIKVNAREAVRQVLPEAVPTDVEEAPDDRTVRAAIAELRRRTGKPVFVTAGRRGIWAGDPEPELVRAVRVPDPVDPTGAGDSATAAAVLALCGEADLQEAALLANLVASITVQQLATTGTAKPDQLLPRLEMWTSQG